ncbi:MAG: hypothetical protein RI964_2883 [Pseudomonadota bacterium]|jgi:hypothetical protein
MSELVFYYRPIAPHPAIEVIKQVAQNVGKHHLTTTFNEFQIDAYLLSDAKQSRVIAIDFDNTITADIAFYQTLIRAYQAQGWQPVVCTVRDDLPENLQEIQTKLHDLNIPVYTTNGKKKRAYMQRQGVRVGLWIDDMFPCVSSCGSQFLRANGISY